MNRLAMPRILNWVMAVTLLLGALAPPLRHAHAAQAESPKLVHRFLEVTISPNGAFVASVEGDSPLGAYLPDLRDLVIRRTAGGAAVAVTLPCGRVPQCWPRSLAWTPDGQRLAFALRTPGSHAYSIYEVAAAGAPPAKLLDFSGTLEGLKYAPDGRLAMLATANAVKEVGATEAGAPIAGDLGAAPTEQRIAILEHGALTFASPADLYVYEYDWRYGAEGFVGTAAPGEGDNNWWTAKLYEFGAGAGTAAGASRVLYAPSSPQQQLAEPKVSRDGRTVAFIAGIMSDFGSTGGDVYTLALGSGSGSGSGAGGGSSPAPAVAANLTAGMAASATSLAWDCSGKLHVRLLAGDRTELMDFGAGRAPVKPRLLWSGAESISGEDAGVSAACSSPLTATSHESFTAPPEIEVGPIGRWHDATALNAGMPPPPRVQSISWKSDGFDVQGWLLLPAQAAGKMPMVTLVHGGPAAAATPNFSGPGLSTELLARGYAIFRPNPRGSFGQGERFAAANVKDFGHGDLRDVLAGIDAAERAAPIDENRLGLMGASYGGFMTMWAVTQTNRFKAAVAAAGISDWLSYYGENGIDAWLLPYFGASVYEDPAVYASSSPINFIRNVHTPTWTYVGERDIECPAPQSQEFWHALTELGVPTGLMIYPGEGHGLREPRHAADAMHRTLAWFDRYLGTSG